MKEIRWYVPHHTQIKPLYTILAQRNILRASTKISYIESAVFITVLSTANMWAFELAVRVKLMNLFIL